MNNIVWEGRFITHFGRLESAPVDADPSTQWLRLYKQYTHRLTWDERYRSSMLRLTKDGRRLDREGQGAFPKALCTQVDVGRRKTMQFSGNGIAELGLYSASNAQQLWEAISPGPPGYCHPHAPADHHVFLYRHNSAKEHIVNQTAEIVAFPNAEPAEYEFVTEFTICLKMNHEARTVQWVMYDIVRAEGPMPPSPFFLGYCSASHGSFIEIAVKSSFLLRLLTTDVQTQRSSCILPLPSSQVLVLGE